MAALRSLWVLRVVVLLSVVFSCQAYTKELAEGEPIEGEHAPVPGEMVSIAAGTFQMGDPWVEGKPSELPVHEVTLSAYEIGKYEVTNREYADVLNWANGQGYLTTVSTTTADAYGVQLLDVDASTCQITWTGSQFVVDTRDGHSMADHPVVEVSWYGAAVYCNWLSERQGLTPCYNTNTWACDFTQNGCHLPTEAQWERAAAWDGSKHYRYGNGSDSISSSSVNYEMNNPLGLSGDPYMSPVGYYSGASSPVGCYDMSGNVFEWCNDWWSRDYTSSAVSNPEGPGFGTFRLLRGGSWFFFDVTFCRSAFRSFNFPDDTSCVLG
ncbi:MAG: SUMF1/EgtB/PvdO family nonheme iron enzyme, partial [Candidatus Hydrogenedentes bacterium]|nr:SUMF1/EgtB/PvdO family nonheme iron enzyme [Candidatus Hydrogenedentota bacterium]